MLRYVTPRTVVLSMLGVWLMVWALAPYPYSEDDISHHMMARWAHRHADVALNIWGRAGFTLLHSPAAQFGYKGTGLMSVVLSLVTLMAVGAWLKSYGQHVAALGMLATGLHTHFFVLAHGALTETVFACFLALGLLAWRKGWLVWACLAMSWTAITRLEGMPLLLVFAGALTWRFHREPGRWTAGRALHVCGLIVLLGVFPFLWNLGLFLNGPQRVGVWKDLVPLLFSNHFVTSESNWYGSGFWGKFVLSSPAIHNPVFVVPVAVGLAVLWRRGHRLPVVYLAAFYGLHSVLWAGGLFQTAGYLRFFASIAPIGGIAAGMGFLKFRDTAVAVWLRGHSWLMVGGVWVALVWVVLHSVLMQVYVKRDYRVVWEAAEVAREVGAGTPGRRLLTNHPGVAMRLGVDLWDPAIAQPTMQRLARAQEWVGDVYVLCATPHLHPRFLLDFYDLPADPFAAAAVEQRAKQPAGPPWFVPKLTQLQPGLQERYRRDVYQLHPPRWSEDLVDRWSARQLVNRFRGPEYAPWPYFARVIERVAHEP